MRRCPVQKCTDVAFVAAATIEGVVTVEGETILARLQILETVRNFRLANPYAKFLGFVERNVGVSVTQLYKMGLA